MNTYNKEFEHQVIIPIDVSSTHIGRAIDRGDYYFADVSRAGVIIPTTYYWKVTATTKDLIITRIDPKFNIGAVTQGNLSHQTDVFLEQSNKNTWTYSGGSADASIGSCINGYFINNQSASKLSAGGAVSGLTGTPDYTVTNANYFLATQGNANSSSGSVNNFFENEIIIVIPAGTTALFRAVTSGTSGGTLDIDTSLFYFERPV